MSSNAVAVNVHMKTTIKDGKQQEIHTMEASGQLFQRGELTVLRFAEPREENLEQTVQTIKLKRRQMSVQRDGAITMNQRFIAGVETEGTYHSPQGPMNMITNTREVTYNWDEKHHEGFIKLRYALVLQGTKTGNYDMDVTIKEV